MSRAFDSNERRGHGRLRQRRVHHPCSQIAIVRLRSERYSIQPLTIPNFETEVSMKGTPLKVVTLFVLVLASTIFTTSTVAQDGNSKIQRGSSSRRCT